MGKPYRHLGHIKVNAFRLSLNALRSVVASFSKSTVFLLHFLLVIIVHMQGAAENRLADVATLLTQLLPPCSPTVRNPAPDSSLKSCFSPIASASAAAHRLRSLQLLLEGTIAASASPFASASSCCSPIALASAAARRFHDQLLLPIASASTAAPRLRPLQLLLARLRPLRLLLPDCILDSSPCPGPNGNVLEHSSQSSRFSK